MVHWLTDSHVGFHLAIVVGPGSVVVRPGSSVVGPGSIVVGSRSSVIRPGSVVVGSRSVVVGPRSSITSRPVRTSHLINRPRPVVVRSRSSVATRPVVVRSGSSVASRPIVVRSGSSVATRAIRRFLSISTWCRLSNYKSAI